MSYQCQNQVTITKFSDLSKFCSSIKSTAEAVTVKPKRKPQGRESPVKLFVPSDKQCEQEITQANCEILELVQIPDDNKLLILVGTSVGLALVNLGSKMVEATLLFETVRKNEGILSSMTSGIKMDSVAKSNIQGCLVNVLVQFSTDRKTAAFQIMVRTDDDHDQGTEVSIVAQDQPKGIFAQIQKVQERKIDNLIFTRFHLYNFRTITK